ncbi:hypothetical protein [Thiolapillus sp.]|uniref:hypothetical protein n=1 Tax=Thiolapillus sp. TaxID=2017437 RepID=UPI003AF5E4A6
MSDTKLTPQPIDEDIERAVDLIEKKEFLTLDKLGVTICILRLKDGTAVVGTNAVSTDSSDLEERYQSAFERALREVVEAHISCGPLDDCQDKTAG